jgi:hypothetical protein
MDAGISKRDRQPHGTTLKGLFASRPCFVATDDFGRDFAHEVRMIVVMLLCERVSVVADVNGHRNDQPSSFSRQCYPT